MPTPRPPVEVALPVGPAPPAPVPVVPEKGGAVLLVPGPAAMPAADPREPVGAPARDVVAVADAVGPLVALALAATPLLRAETALAATEPAGVPVPVPVDEVAVDSPLTLLVPATGPTAPAATLPLPPVAPWPAVEEDEDAARMRLLPIDFTERRMRELPDAAALALALAIAVGLGSRFGTGSGAPLES